MSSNNLFTPLNIGRLTLNNRIIMAPLTRCRATPDDHIPSDLMIQHYADRADAGLIITECSMITPLTSAFYSEPGVYSEEQLTEWRKITDAVHAKGGKIYCQIWHAGRAAHPDLNQGAETVSSSAIAIDGLVHGPNGKVQHVVPRELTVNEISDIVELFATAAKNCVEVAGFDGVEIHGANGYLIDQFLKNGTNHRTDNYGGSIENRARFALEVLKAVTDAVGGDRVGIRFSPINGYNSQVDSDPEALAEYLAKEVNAFNLAYVHILRRDLTGVLTEDYTGVYRKHFKGVIIGNAQYTREEADEAIANGEVDAVAFGAAYVANADLVTRFKRHAELNTPDYSTFFIPGAKGYNDYPTLDE
ncbi:NADH:flavin oxidoreductase [Thraustotheca clavata]|uniref:NADH:flavin oxidoreductase n=1 Tax=Thraustotheca clavata TaxID=74557 RepID=A0A1V9Y4Y1_9STRA|nr:NADH:flavin oxidoreductase [Thraustotheca clavata]